MHWTAGRKRLVREDHNAAVVTRTDGPAGGGRTAAAVLNAGGEQSRNWALLFSAASLAVVLPIAVLWLFAVVLLRRRR
jgi:hypothetical protein